MVIKKSFKSLLKKSTAEEKNYLQSMFLFAQGEISTDELKNYFEVTLETINSDR